MDISHSDSLDFSCFVPRSRNDGLPHKIKTEEEERAAKFPPLLETGAAAPFHKSLIVIPRRQL